MGDPFGVKPTAEGRFDPDDAPCDNPAPHPEHQWNAADYRDMVALRGGAVTREFLVTCKGVGDPGLLTPEEHHAMRLTADLHRAICGIAGDAGTRDNDLHESVLHIHALQNMILAQAAGRAYPDRYRLMGETLTARAEVAPDPEAAERLRDYWTTGPGSEKPPRGAFDVRTEN